MEESVRLDLPSLIRRRFENEDDPAGCGVVHAYTDDVLFRQTGVRIAFTERSGGVSPEPFAQLNLGAHVDDDPQNVSHNRQMTLDALGFSHAHLIVPKQVHGKHVVALTDDAPAAVLAAQAEAEAGADALVIDVADTAALLCFADCVPLIMVAPNGAFAVAHAGWRGVMAHVAPQALARLCAVAQCSAADCNIYIGPYIHAECFETNVDLQKDFVAAFGADCALDERHVNLGTALKTDLLAAGASPARIADADVCTVCENERFFSYRAQGGACGRHGALAVRRA